MGSFLVKSFGCRTAQADGAALAWHLRRAGFTEAERAGEADLVIFNSCTVTAAADEDVRRAVVRLHRRNPAARILVTGCYAQRAPRELARLPGVKWVVGNSHKTEIPAIAAGPVPATPEIRVGEIASSPEWRADPVGGPEGNRTRPNLKIQDGCNRRCSYCIIPSVRGRSRSAPPEVVVEQVRRLAGRYREIVLTGIDLGRWGREPGLGMRLAELVRKLLAETPVERLRLSSIEPTDLSDELLEVMASSPRVARHVHTPLQSGSPAVLRRMRRPYRPDHYAERLERVRRLMPEAAIGADVLVGFPGETEDEFEQTRRFLHELPVTYLHVFTYSPRPGTPAAALPGQVPVPVRKQRNRLLRELGAEKNRAFRQRFLGRKLSVVTLSRPPRALSDNYIQVELATPRPPNRLIEVEVAELTAAGVRERVPWPVLGQEPAPRESFRA